jgi:UDP-N-acetylglucosamine 2-epimerase (non-hydrolysing)
LHRPSNVDEKSILHDILESMSVLAKEFPLVFPIHPRTERKINEFHLNNLIKDLIVIPPVPYLDMVKLMPCSNLVFTDSGGVQEETTILDIPCLTLCENTERPVTIEKGSNQLVGTKQDYILREAKKILSQVGKKKDRPLTLGRFSRHKNC